METIHGFPFWILWFDQDGKQLDKPAVDNFIGTELANSGVTDLFIFSHGWNNDQAAARSLYTRFFEKINAVIQSGDAKLKPGAKIGVAGVFWPSMYWPDETNPARAGGAASADGGEAMSDGDLARALKDVYPKSEHQTIEELAKLLDAKPDDNASKERFQKLMSTLAPTKDAADAPEDRGEDDALFKRPATEVFERMDAAAPGPRIGGEAGLIDNAWNGAKNALRQTSYFEMKKRAGKVGQDGLAPLIDRLQKAVPALRIHLIGHSFGARVVSFSLRGLAPHAKPAESPIKSMLLLQGAFSHFAFADIHPYDKKRAGALKGMAARVDGPILVTHSNYDTAVGQLYSAASFTSRDDAAASEDRAPRWGAIGSTGAKEVNAAEVGLGNVGYRYAMQPGAFINLDGNELIKQGGPPSGAHSDIFYPEIAWACLSGAQVITA